jgi:hypothetical protein
VVSTTSYKSEGQGFGTWWGQWIFSSYLILPAALGPGMYSVSNRNEYLKQKEKNFWGVESGRHVRLTSSPSVSRLSRQCGILNISQPYRPPWPIMGIALLFTFFNVKHLGSYVILNRQPYRRKAHFVQWDFEYAPFCLHCKLKRDPNKFIDTITRYIIIWW